MAVGKIIALHGAGLFDGTRIGFRTRLAIGANQHHHHYGLSRTQPNPTDQQHEHKPHEVIIHGQGMEQLGDL